MEPVEVQTLGIRETLKNKIQENYLLLKARYGEAMAKMILGAALFGFLSPIPGSSILLSMPFVGLGELLLWFQNNPKAKIEVQEMFPQETEDLFVKFSEGRLLN
jgi:hypothetical protein